MPAEMLAVGVHVNDAGDGVVLYDAGDGVALYDAGEGDADGSVPSQCLQTLNNE